MKLNCICTIVLDNATFKEWYCKITRSQSHYKWQMTLRTEIQVLPIYYQTYSRQTSVKAFKDTSGRILKSYGEQLRVNTIHFWDNQGVWGQWLLVVFSGQYLQFLFTSKNYRIQRHDLLYYTVTYLIWKKTVFWIHHIVILISHLVINS